MYVQNEGDDTFLIANLSMVTEDSFFLSRKYQAESGHTTDLVLGWIFKNAKSGLHGSDS